MKPFFVLLLVFGLSLLGIRLFQGNWDYQTSGNVAMCVMLLFTSIGHFAFTKGMSMMIPGFIPFRKELVWLTGILEIVAGAALLYPPARYKAAIFLIVFFILLLPANVYAAMKNIDYEKANYEGSGLSYLSFRVPLQIFFIAWLYWFACR